MEGRVWMRWVLVLLILCMFAAVGVIAQNGNKKVRIVLEGVDKFNNLTGSLYYPDGESTKNLALELLENGLAKYVDWSASLLEDDARRKLKNAELQAKKTKLRIWTNYVPPATNSKVIHD